jgi:hypothetical protein
MYKTKKRQVYLSVFLFYAFSERSAEGWRSNPALPTKQINKGKAPSILECFFCLICFQSNALRMLRSKILLSPLKKSKHK